MTTFDVVSRPPYKKPPIIEAVIAIHFAVPLESKTIDAFAQKRRTDFPHREDMVEMSATFDIQTKKAASSAKIIGKKLTSANGTRVVIMVPTQMAVIQRAPYTDWDTLYVEAREHWNVLRKIIQRITVSVVSARYINRIDIPAGIDGRINLHEYFNAGLSLPQHVQAMALQTFHINCALLDTSGQYKFVLQVASTPSPLIDHISFTIDIDVSTTDPILVNEKKMWELISSLRQQKNDLFESCITPETRKLFQ